MSHHIAVYVDREKTLILSVFSKFSSHLKDNSWLFYFQMQSICFSTLLNSVLILYSQKKLKTNVSFLSIFLLFFCFLNLLPTALNNWSNNRQMSLEMLFCPSLIWALMDCANITQIIMKNSKKKNSKKPQKSDNIYIKWNIRKLRLYVCVFLSLF